MITLAILSILWGLFSYYRINKRCKENGADFNPFNGTLVDFIGFMLGMSAGMLAIAAICIIHFP